MTDIQGAMEFEFNMVKNPVTGKIPEGIRDAELNQVREILTREQLTENIEANAYSFQGPNNLGGRTRALVYDIRFDGVTNNIIIAGGVSGGVFKSTDNGASFTRKSPTSDLFSVTALAQDTRVGFRDTWYYAGGEFTGNSAGATGAAYRGKGVYKSTDNGETWTFLATSNTGVYEVFDNRADYISKIVVDPTSGNVYAAGVDAIYRSTDAGSTWGIVLTSGSGSLSSGFVTDLVVTSGGKFYASFSGTSPTAPTDMPGVWSSLTGASGSWTKIAGTGAATNPAGWNVAAGYGRVVLAIAPSLESRVYAVYWNGVSYGCPGGTPEAELYRWDNGTSTWTDLSANLPNEGGCLVGNDPFAVQTGYDLVMSVKPDNADVVFLGGTNIYRSTSGFTTTAATTRVGGYVSPASYGLYLNSHPDIHAIIFQPGSPGIMLCGNDGGIQRTTDNLAGTVVWTQINTGYRTYQYYYVAMDPNTGNNKVLGGAQDNGSTRNIGGTGTNFELVRGGDGVSVGLSNVILASTYEYVGTQLGNINRRNSASALGAVTIITPPGESGTGLFVTLFKLDPDNTENLYYANDNALYRTTSASTVTSAAWTSMTGIATSVGAANDITAIATTRGTYSAVTASLFMGTSNGRLFRLNDPAGVAAATAPVDITGGTFPAGFVSSIAVNPRNDDTLLVTFSNYSVSSIWWTGNANSAIPTWTAVEGSISLPSIRSSSIHAVPNSIEVQYFVGTSVGLFTVTGLPAVTTWVQDGISEIGNAVVSNIAFRPSDANMLIGTHGSGIWKTVLSQFPLPVEISEFKGSLYQKHSLLQWTTVSEYNSKHFEIEKSFDGYRFRKIAIIPAAGSSFAPLNYSYIDKEPLTEINYYRLRSVDNNEESKISNTVAVKNPKAKQDIIIMGNPFNNEILIRLVKPVTGKAELKLIDMNGKEVTRVAIARGQQQVLINVREKNLSNGVYTLQAGIDGEVFSTRLIKQ